MESLVPLAFTGTECIKNKQTDRQTFFFIYIDRLQSIKPESYDTVRIRNVYGLYTVAIRRRLGQTNTAPYFHSIRPYADRNLIIQCRISAPGIQRRIFRPENMKLVENKILVKLRN